MIPHLNAKVNYVCRICSIFYFIVIVCLFFFIEGDSLIEDDSLIEFNSHGLVLCVSRLFDYIHKNI